MTSLSHIKSLQKVVLECKNSYNNSPLGRSYEEHEALRIARNNYQQSCVDFCEEMMENECVEEELV